ncbi:chemotaxis protein CheD [Tissierella praeacuta]|uniref:Probable chemoreceptor glutamine deamidase CheD n=1 Tax=Tissierella praeacuta DSM 18095 TaxID=1123404 RepID=A0A1M4SKJ3_9FIRM|nr:chemotaxis protein CheD [Tissierella praeacuta]MBU5254780.1 chemotaxis protein CheD [Tissierella praeacuta]TCU72678.1 chemotaxis protein CheD [Tissierella praeacuta]SHE32517.1 chemotaxis protein CheD [Tissierella praeacuta DSM 18095]SUP01503.1 Chemoreceptor glutamine deamidase CheD [Tissierella praeacuta]
MDVKIIKIGMADLNVAKAPNLLTTLGLGSCVGITLYDKINKIAGLAHIMLPSSREIKNNDNKAKFADTGIEELLDLMLKSGANKNNLVAKIAGGSQMFNFNSNNNILKIGERNVIATKDKLKELNIKIVSEDTGGNFGRTIILNSIDGLLQVKTIGHGEKTI